MTGTVPYDNGIVGEHWMDRKTLRPMYCVDDATCEGWLTSEKYSPVALNVSTVTDELKMATGGRALVYSIAPDADAAILAAGHAADGAFLDRQCFRAVEQHVLLRPVSGLGLAL